MDQRQVSVDVGAGQPFICKAYDEPYVNFATKVMLGENKVKDFNFTPKKKGYAIKVPVFSFKEERLTHEPLLLS